LVCPLAENQQIQIYIYWFAPERKKPAFTDLQLLVYPLAEKTNKYRFTVIGLPLSATNNCKSVFAGFPLRGKPITVNLYLLGFFAKGQTNNCKSVFAGFFR
jgi:hypothetical protein